MYGGECFGKVVCLRVCEEGSTVLERQFVGEYMRKGGWRRDCKKEGMEVRV